MAPIPVAYTRKTIVTGEVDSSPLVLQEPAVLERTSTPPPDEPAVRFLRDMKTTARGHIVAIIAEFLGTMMFLFFAYAAVHTAGTKTDSLDTTTNFGSLSLLQIGFISAVFGTSLIVNVWVFYRVSGGMFNPAVALGLWVAGAFDWVRLVCVVPAQFAGGIAAAGLISAILPGPLNVDNSLGAGTSPAQGFFLELFITAELVMIICMAAVEKSRTSFMAPLPIGLALMIGHMIAINYTGCSMNPARTLGPAVVEGVYPSYMWLYFIGPFLGGVLAAFTYRLFKVMAYQTANPGQDDDGLGFYRVVAGPAQQLQQPVQERRKYSHASGETGRYNNGYPGSP